MKLSPYVSISMVLTLGVILVGCSSPSVPNNTSTPSSSQSDEPTPTSTDGSTDVPAPITTTAPEDEVKDAGFEVGVTAQELVSSEWPKSIAIPDVKAVTAAKKFNNSEVGGLLVNSTGGDVEAIQPYLASLEEKGMTFIGDHKADGIVVYYYENADYVLEVIVTPVNQPDSGGYAGTTRFKVTPANQIQ